MLYFHSGFNALTIFLTLLFITTSIAPHRVAAGKRDKDTTFLPDPVSPRQNVRFYKANKQLQAAKIMLSSDKAASSGCNNFLKKVRVFKALQIGFQSCSIYREADCEVPSIIPFNSEKRAHKSYLLTEGVAWFASGENERGEDAKSWHCNKALADGELRLEAGLAKKEVSRLEDEQEEAEERLIRAQNAFNKATKDAEKALANSERAMAEAIRRGVIEPPKEECEEEAQQETSNTRTSKLSDNNQDTTESSGRDYSDPQLEEECSSSDSKDKDD